MNTCFFIVLANRFLALLFSLCFLLSVAMPQTVSAADFSEPVAAPPVPATDHACAVAVSYSPTRAGITLNPRFLNFPGIPRKKPQPLRCVTCSSK
jgi:hypothetical protein